MDSRSICSAEGWYVEYKDGSTHRVACFQHDSGIVTPFIVIGPNIYAAKHSEIASIWYVHDEH